MRKISEGDVVRVEYNHGGGDVKAIVLGTPQDVGDMWTFEVVHSSYGDKQKGDVFMQNPSSCSLNCIVLLVEDNNGN